MSLEIKPMKTKKNLILNRELMEKNIIMPHPSNTIISSGPGSGKSCLIYNLLHEPIFYGPSYELLDEDQKKKGPKPYFDAIFLFLPSGDDAYDPLIKKNIILPQHVCIRPSEADLNRVLDQQKNLIAEVHDISKSPKILFIFDDCVKERKLLMSKSFLEIFTTARHLNASCIVTSQYLNLVPKSIRQACDVLISFKLNRAEMEILSDQYCPPLMPKQKFKEMIHNTTKDTPNNKHNFLMIFRKISDINMKFRQNIGNCIQIDKDCTLSLPRFSKRQSKRICDTDSDDEEIKKEIKVLPFQPELNNDLNEKDIYKKASSNYKALPPPRLIKSNRPPIM